MVDQNPMESQGHYDLQLGSKGFFTIESGSLFCVIFFLIYNVNFIFFLNYKSHYTLEIMRACISVGCDGLNIINQYFF